MELEDHLEHLARMLMALEPVALYFVLQSKAVRLEQRHARAQAMLASFGIWQNKDAGIMSSTIPDAYMLTAAERRSCVERLNVPFVGTRRVRIATAVLLKLNALENWESSQGVVESVVSLEHVMPQTMAATSWEADWPNAEKLEESLHLLGNLGVVNTRMNSKMGDSGFAIKKVEFAKSPYALTREIARYASWREQEVVKGSMAFLQNQFRCPPTLGARRT
ncbi:hypothetical protein T484DRAFT_1762049 [Baffinella frigidus]|nr:hypothetical protein T484DRAFT_1762049 [Cryptophyta sp. CCMP2293]